MDPAELHYRLASLLAPPQRGGRYHGTNDVQSARLHVLKALEEAPRYRAAHRLLIELVPRIEAARKLEQEARIQEARIQEAKSQEATTQVKRATDKSPTDKSARATNGKEKRF